MTPFEITVTTLSVLTFAVGFGPRLLAAARSAKPVAQAAPINDQVSPVVAAAAAIVALPDPDQCRRFLVAIRAKAAQVTDVERRTAALEACDTLDALFDERATVKAAIAV